MSHFLSLLQFRGDAHLGALVEPETQPPVAEGSAADHEEEEGHCEEGEEVACKRAERCGRFQRPRGRSGPSFLGPALTGNLKPAGEGSPPLGAPFQLMGQVWVWAPVSLLKNRSQVSTFGKTTTRLSNRSDSEFFRNKQVEARSCWGETGSETMEVCFAHRADC